MDLSYEILIPMHISNLILAFKVSFLHVQTCMWPPLCRSVIVYMAVCPFSIHPLSVESGYCLLVFIGGGGLGFSEVILKL
jgi:hypothetical protein